VSITAAARASAPRSLPAGLRQTIIVCCVHDLPAQRGPVYWAIGALDGTVFATGDSAQEVLNGALIQLQKWGGGRLSIESGTYVLEAPLHVPSAITIAGAGPSTVLRVAPENVEGIAIHVPQAHHTVITDLLIEGGKATESAAPPQQFGVAGIVLDHCSDCVIDRVIVRNFAQYGFWLRNYSSLCKIHCCTGANNGSDDAGANFLLDSLCAWTDIEDVPGSFCPNYVSACHAYAGGNGFEVRHSVCQNVVGCMVYNAGGHSFAVTQYSPSTLISGCRAFQGRQNGVLVADSPEINISSSIFCWHEGHGIELSNVTWGTICANEIMDAGTANADNQCHSIYLHRDVKGVQITGNSVFTWADQFPTAISIFADESCRNIGIVANNVNYYREQAVAMHERNGLVAENVDQEQAYPNPNMEPYATKLPSYGIGYGRYDDARMQRYLNLVTREA
jgi:hypothetical protein